MTMIIKTITGEEIDTGFWGPDTSRIQLGNLPPISTQQFADYAARALINEVIPRIDGDTRAEWTRSIQDLHRRIGGLPVMQMLNKTTDQQEREAMVAMAVPLEPAGLYLDNPFKAENDGRSIRIGVPGRKPEHIVASQDLFNLASYVIHGGFLGWDERGAYEEVHRAARQLDDVLSGSQ